MFTTYLKQMSTIYDDVDSILIINEKGYVEYSAFRSKDNKTLENAGYTGMHLFDVYPDLTEETSAVFRVMKTGQPIVEEFQSQRDCHGNLHEYTCSTFPIGMGNRIIGAISAAVFKNRGVRYTGTSASERRNSKNDLYKINDIITVDERMKMLKEQALKVASGDSSVMIIGDTGTGKELFAQSIHSHSVRADGPFISQNCSAIPMGLLEGILFGTVKGSYTGAEDRRGLFEQADKGTLFLDELNSMEPALQSKILKAVEEGHIRRVGDDKLRKIDVRIISAINHDPLTAIKEGKLREDLYYRLGVVQLNLPPLQDRQGDIPVLVEHFISEFNRTGIKKIKGYSELAMNIMMNYSWPGNVRELRNAVEYGFNMTSEEVMTINDLPAQLMYSDKKVAVPGIPEKEKECALHNDELLPDGMSLENGISLTEVVESYEKEIIRKACSMSRNLSSAARMLGVSRQTLRYKMEKYEIEI